MNVLVTGANGQLGNALRVLTAGLDPETRFLFTDVTDASEESVAMLQKLAGPDVDTTTRRLDITDPEAILLFCRINNEYRYTWYHVPDGTVLQKAYPADDEAWLSAGEKAFVRNTDGSVSLINLRTDEEIRLPDLGAESVYTLNDAENRVLCIDMRMYDSTSGVLSKNFNGFSVCDLENHTVVRLDREPSDDADEWSVFWLDNERFAVWAENPADGFGDLHVYRLHTPEG